MSGTQADRVHNGRVKLAALPLNNASVAITTTGVVTPLVNALYGSAPFSAMLFKGALALLLVGVAFHVVAQFFLGRLRDV